MDFIIFNFLKKTFPIKRINKNKKNWVKVIIIPQGYISQNTIIYPITHLTYEKYNEIILDITKITSYMYGFNKEKVKPIVTKYIKSIISVII